MASITKKPNGTYLVRFSVGRDDLGNHKTVSKIFKPSKPNLGYAALQKELNFFIETTEVQILNGEFTGAAGKNSVPTSPGKMLFSDFCEKYMEIKKNDLAPGTFSFYQKIIWNHLIPTYGKMHLDEFRVRHVQDYITFVISKGRQDIHAKPGDQMAAGTGQAVCYGFPFHSIPCLQNGIHRH